MKIKFLDLKKQYLSIKEEIDRAIFFVINEAAFIGGEYSDKFENDFANYLGVNYCVGVGNGTDALEIALASLDLPKGSEVIVPANSFAATAEAVVNTGFLPVFADCNKKYTIDLDDLKNKITSKTSAVIAVHLYGLPCNMDEIIQTAKEHNLKIIEDAAQAHGAEYKGRKVGGLSDVGIFSFYPGKILGAYGDAGAIVTNSRELAEKCRRLSNHGRLFKYDHQIQAKNSRLDGLQAAVLSVKLKYIDQWIDKRIKQADIYSKELKNCSQIILPQKDRETKHVFHLFVIRAEKRDQLKDFLKEKEIETGIHYPVSLPKLPAFRHFNQFEEKILANETDKELLSLPIGEHLSEKDIIFVSENIKDFYSKYAKKS